MVRRRYIPDCVTACPNGVFYFGDENEDTVTNGDETLSFTQLIRDEAVIAMWKNWEPNQAFIIYHQGIGFFLLSVDYDGKSDELKERYKDILESGERK